MSDPRGTELGLRHLRDGMGVCWVDMRLRFKVLVSQLF